MGLRGFVIAALVTEFSANNLNLCIFIFL